MVEYKKGYFARSLAGHDKGNLYIIIEGTKETGMDDTVYVCDGRCKTVDHLKKKKTKHIQVIHFTDPKIASLIENGQPVRNEDIKYAIKTYNKKD
ncbi:MAG: KOW domain-containing RNA-binding protein [Lachnospiraceae bacterium]|nr:KOW domain-containing RNA-binding protein [Lachnospiraceae bacterium]